MTIISALSEVEILDPNVHRRAWLIRVILGKVPLGTVTQEDRIAAELLAGRIDIIPPWVEIPEETEDDPERAEAIERLAYVAKVQIRAKRFRDHETTNVEATCTKMKA